MSSSFRRSFSSSVPLFRASNAATDIVAPIVTLVDFPKRIKHRSPFLKLLCRKLLKMKMQLQILHEGLPRFHPLPPLCQHSESAHSHSFQTASRRAISALPFSSSVIFALYSSPALFFPTLSVTIRTLYAASQVSLLTLSNLLNKCSFVFL
jgi:hypothetical protein